LYRCFNGNTPASDGPSRDVSLRRSIAVREMVTWSGVFSSHPIERNSSR
jgi:hypothetical protein